MVATWFDLSGNQRHATQGTLAKKPLYKVNIINGKPVVRGDGVDDILVSSAITLAACTVMVVAQPVTLDSTNADRPLVDIRTGTVDDIFFSMTANSIGNTRWHFSDYDGAATHGIYNDAATAGAFAAGVPGIYTGIVNTAGTSWAAYKNGALLATASNGRAPLGSYTPTLFQSSSGGGSANCDLAEVILYTRDLSAYERRRVERYLSRKYGIAVV